MALSLLLNHQHTKITRKQRQRGQFLVELLIAMAIMGLLMPVLISGLVVGRDSLPQQARRAQARLMIQSLTDTMRIIRERGWQQVETNGVFHPVTDGATYTLAPGSDVLNGFTRSIVIEPVYRLNFGEIVTSGGTLDPSTKRVTIRLAWDTPSLAEMESVLYMTRYLDNISQGDSTLADFEAGTLTGTIAISTSGEDGQVILGSGGSGGWCSPFESQVGELNLPGQSVATGITAVEGRAFISNGANASGNPFTEVSISNPTDESPPTPFVSLEYASSMKSNDVFGELGYGYIATDTNDKEVAIINTATGLESGYFNAPGNSNGKAVAVADSVGFMVSSNNRIYSFNLEQKTGSRPLRDPDGAPLSGTGAKVRISVQYAYVALSSGSNELQIFDVQNPNNILLKGSANTGTRPARDVAVNESGTRAFIVTEYSATEPEVYAIDLSEKVGTRPVIGTFDTGTMDPKGVALVPGNRLIVVGHGGEEYQVITVTDNGNNIGMSRCGGLDLNVNVNGVASVYEQDGDAYSYIITTDSSREFKMLEGGPGGQFSQSGTFESRTLDAGYTTAFNYAIVTKQEPPQTSLRFQVAVADPVLDSCDLASFFFVGPGGDPEAFYSDEGPISFDDDGVGYENPGRCFRYKAFLETSDSSQSPVLESMQINYSP